MTAASDAARDLRERPRHAEIAAAHPDGSVIRVDVGIHPLLAGLWHAGMVTEFSCEGYPLPDRPIQWPTPFHGYITFTHVEQAWVFYRDTLIHLGNLTPGSLTIEVDTIFAGPDAPRGCVRFERDLLPDLIETWTPTPVGQVRPHPRNRT